MCVYKCLFICILTHSHISIDYAMTQHDYRGVGLIEGVLIGQNLHAPVLYVLTISYATKQHMKRQEINMFTNLENCFGYLPLLSLITV
jgi:hypothetical protein